MPKDESAPRYTVGSVAKALRLVDMVATGPVEGLTLSELARASSASKSATYALVRTLVDSGYLRDIEPGPRYALGIALVRLGDVASRQLPLSQVTAPVLQDLSRETGLTIRVAVVDNGYPVFVDRVDALGAVRFHAPLGVRELPHTSAAGKAILSALPDSEVRRIAAECGLPRRTRKTISDVRTLQMDLAVARRRGYAVDDEEDVDGVFCVASVVLDHTGSCAGAISVTGLRLDLPDSRLHELGIATRDHARRVSGLLGASAEAMAR
jgi:IclR family acetate operon transcriptional repressor